MANPKTVTGGLRLPREPQPVANRHRVTLKGGPWAGETWAHSDPFDATTLPFSVRAGGSWWSGRYVKGRWQPSESLSPGRGGDA
jgi:hypothetical protein